MYKDVTLRESWKVEECLICTLTINGACSKTLHRH